jgi:hypothetical protein
MAQLHAGGDTPTAKLPRDCGDRGTEVRAAFDSGMRASSILTESPEPGYIALLEARLVSSTAYLRPSAVMLDAVDGPGRARSACLCP